MFEQSLLQSAPAHRGRRGLATACSFLLEIGLVGLLVLLPLIYTEALPGLHYTVELPPPPAAPAPRPPDEQRPVPPSRSEVVGATVLAPPAVPTTTHMLRDDVPPPTLNPGPSVPGGTSPGGPGEGVLNSILSAHAAAPPPLPTPAAPRVIQRSGGVMAGYLISQVKPAYPPLARQARVEGAVVLAAIISRDGRIENLRVLSGHPLLAPAAIEAVRQWRYRAFMLSGEPVAVETQVTVNFVLSPGS